MEHIVRAPILLCWTSAISHSTSTQNTLFPTYSLLFKNPSYPLGHLLMQGSTCSLPPLKSFYKQKNKDISIGVRDSATFLWIINLGSGRSIPIQPSTIIFAPEYVINSAYTQSSLPQLAKYLHKAAFSPVPSTYIKAIEADIFSTWPGLTAELIRKNLPKSTATTKDHMREVKQDIRSTSKNQEKDAAPDETASIDHKNLVFVKRIEITGKLSIAQT